ncbi:hypothetical protein RclHR1_00150016 [Rhizophagus clarus]|uniref:Uncharacterized protein n=1 Tax=Rhizophagus clarus TaxID=94130 RepID=A0A2Z6QE13_9GLOM|nr:hypothetical protein RclHR1_00150016 [Rhizophagus clarus]GET02297.1 hypothetical protein RCL_e2701_RclHR1_00150016 [Rhizophagus clarus]
MGRIYFAENHFNDNQLSTVITVLPMVISPTQSVMAFWTNGQLDNWTIGLMDFVHSKSKFNWTIGPTFSSDRF